MKIRKAIQKDLPIIVEIYKTEFSKPPYNESWTIKKAKKKIDFFFNFYDFYTIIFNNEVVGFIAVNPRFMYPGEVAFGEEIAIREDCQGKGIGTFVFNKIFKIYKKKGFKKFMGIAATKGRAIKLYKKLRILPSKKGVLIEKKLK